MVNGCEAKDPTVKEWTRQHEAFHTSYHAAMLNDLDALHKRLDRQGRIIDWHSKVIWGVSGALVVLLLLVLRDPAVLLAVVRGG